MTGDYAQTGTRVGRAELLSLAEDVFESTGMGVRDAGLLADSLVQADFSGVHSHGVLRVPEYVEKLTSAGVDPVGIPEVVSDRGSTFVVDGGNSMGQIGCVFAMEHVIERAGETGIAAAAIRGSNHSGACSYYSEMALKSDMIGIATTNALPTMAPVGGADRILGIDPLAVAIPAGEEHPISYDAAFSGSAHGKIRVYAQKGLDLPEGWALDSVGRATTDPLAAIDGLLVPIGGHKGASLAMIFGILSSMLSGAAYGTELGNMEDGPVAGLDGHFVMALNVASFVDVGEFKSRVDGAIRQVHESRRSPGVERLLVPGELEFETRERNAGTGIPLSVQTLSDLGAAAAGVGVDVSDYAWLPEGGGEG